MQVDLTSVLAKLKLDLDEAESVGAAALPKAVAEQVLFRSVVYIWMSREHVLFGCSWSKQISREWLLFLSVVYT